jgi:hypothetical protein
MVVTQFIHHIRVSAYQGLISMVLGICLERTCTHAALGGRTLWPCEWSVLTLVLVLSLRGFIAGRRLSELVDWAFSVAHCGAVFLAQAVVGNLVSAMFSSQRQLDLWRKQSAVSGAAAAGAEIEEDGDGEAVAARV